MSELGTDVAAAAEAAATPPTPAPVEQADPFDGGQQTFDRAYVEKLRNEAASNRVKAREAEEKVTRYSRFDGIDDNDLTVFGELADRYKKGDLEGAAEWARDIAGQLSPAERGAVAEATGAASTDTPLTRAEFDRLMAEREQEITISQSQADLDREAAALGYGPDSIYYLPLMKAASDGFAKTGTVDLKAAATQIEAERQRVVEAYLADKANDASRSPAAAPAGGGATSPQGEPKSLAEAHARAKVRTAEAARRGEFG